jgi:short subunit dehydrogenase-like uncharacterized protein
VPALCISKSTMKDIINALNDKQREKLAQRIARKDYEYIKSYMSTSSDAGEAVVHLKKLANDFFWGDVNASTHKNAIELTIHSNVFTSKKEKQFYDLIYLHFMSFFGYKTSGYNKLTNLYRFSYEKSED